MRFTRQQLLIGLLIVAGLALGSVINGRLPKAEDVMGAEFVAHGRVGQPVGLRTGIVTVNKVDASTKVSLDGSVAETSGIWLVVDATFEASHEMRYLPVDNIRAVAADGRQFGDIAPLRPICGPVQPRLPLSCTFAIELDPEALAGLHLRIPADSLIVGPPENNNADIDLGITADKADGLAKGATVLPLGARQGRGQP